MSDITEFVPLLVSELCILATCILKGSIIESLTPVVVEMISIVVPKHAMSFYCGPDTGVRVGKNIVLSIFKGIADFFGELENAIKEKKESEDILEFMVKARQHCTGSKNEVVARLLATQGIPLTPETAVGVIDCWFCDPTTMARAFDRILQFSNVATEPTEFEPTCEIGAAPLGSVNIETRKDELGDAIGAAIDSVMRAAGINKLLRGIEHLVFFFGAKSFIGRKLDESLDPTIDIHIMNAVLLQKLLSGPQSTGMPKGVACVDYFYGNVLDKLILENVPKPARASAQLAVATVGVVTSRSDMLQDLVYNFVLPRLCTVLEQLNAQKPPAKQ